MHCFNHQLHLVIVHALGENSDIKRFFGTCNKLYNFVRRPNLSSLYDGSQLQCLLEHRWSGHLATTSAIIANHICLIDLLESCEEGFEAEISIEACGLLKHIRSNKFMFIAYTIQKVLSELKPVDKLLQDRDCDINSGIQLVQTALDNLKHIRDEADETFKTLCFPWKNTNWKTAMFHRHVVENCKRIKIMQLFIPVWVIHLQTQNSVRTLFTDSYLLMFLTVALENYNLDLMNEIVLFSAL